jgi:fatty-acyl-CoA synthase
VIEEALVRHPAVETAAAVGLPDTYAGELPMAFVQLKPNATATPRSCANSAARKSRARRRAGAGRADPDHAAHRCGQDL